MRILITGNLGYVGPVVVEHLAAVRPEARLSGLDTGWTAHAVVTAAPLPELALAEQRFGDVRDLRAAGLEGFDAIVHLAAISNDPMSRRWEALTRAINLGGTASLAAEARRAGVRRFVLASSCSVYGPGEDGWLTEESPTAPLTPYAESKLAAEQALADLAGPGFTVTAFRFATAYGHSPRLRLDLVLNDFTAAAVRTGRIELNSDGQAWRPLIHVRDMARLIDWALSREGSGSNAFAIYNGGSSAHNWRVRELAQVVRDSLGANVEVRLAEGAGPDQRSYRVSFGKIEREAPEYLPREQPHNAVREMAAALAAIQPYDRARFVRLETVAQAMDSRPARCRSCGAAPGPVVLDLGRTALANSYLDPVRAAEEPAYRLRVRLCESCKLVQLDETVPPDRIFAQYAYLSSYSDSWLAHARGLARTATERLSLDQDSRVVEIASNDGYLLNNFVAAGIPCLGIEPSSNAVERAQESGVPTMQRFFSAEVAQETAASFGRASLIIANNVLAHVPALNDFVRGLRILLRPDGVVCFEFPHLLQLVRHGQFDTIYHEHYSYFSLIAADHLFRRHRLRAFDVDELPTHGGSLRVWVCHLDSARSPASPEVSRIMAAEYAAGLDRVEGFAPLSDAASRMRTSLMALLGRLASEGKPVAAYGAAAKGNTLLNYCGAGPRQIQFVADRNPLKQGKLLPGSRIPIVAPDDIFRHKPAHVLILPWNLDAEVREQLAGIREWGGEFISLPELVS